MSLHERLSKLSPEKLAILERRLGRGGVVAAPESPALRGSSNGTRLPLSFAQERLWLLEEIEPGHSFYNLTELIPLSGPVKLPLLEQALNGVVRRHETLRTTFGSADGTPYQMVAPELTIPVELCELSSTPETQWTNEAAAHALREGQRTFDLQHGPLLRAELLQFSETAHFLLLTMHHIVSDGWSMGILYRELSTMYSALLFNRPHGLPALTTQYGDFASWQRSQLQGAEMDRLLFYWKRKLEGIPALSELPTDRPRPRVQVFRGATYAVTVPAPLLSKLTRLAFSRDATLFMVLLTAFKVLIGQYTSQTDIVVGSPIANRSRSDWEQLIGFFVNTLVLRTDLSGEPSFHDALARVRETALEAYAHQDLPFEKLVADLHPTRSLSHAPLFQIAFALQNVEPGVQGNQVLSGHIQSGSSKFDLTLSTAEVQSGLSAAFEYNSELFDSETVAALAARYQALLEQIALHPDWSISDLLLPPGQERKHVLELCVGPETENYAGLVMPELCETQARIRPHAAALTFQNRHLTWHELNQLSKALGHTLRAMCAGRGTIVGLCVNRSLELPLGILGILRSGAAFLPLDPLAPPSRQAALLRDAEARILIADQHTAGLFSDYSGRILRIDEQADWLHDATETEQIFRAATEDLAYVIYTSGSTGQPKGVLVEHRGLCNVVAAQRTVFDLKPETRILQFAPPSFDASVFELLLALGSGGTLCLAPRERIMPGTDLLRTLRDQRIQVLVIPPSSLATLPDDSLPDLTTIISAGETLPSELVSRWARERRFFNAYGPTETTIWATIAECRPGNRIPPIGKPIPNTQVYVTDTALRPVPTGVPGEIVVGGVGVTRGYLGRPELTSERFIPDPFSPKTGTRLYRTGDRGRFLPTGDIQFLGRSDQQIKIRGYRIEPDEIRSALLRHPAIVDAVVFAHRNGATKYDELAEARLVAFCLRHPDRFLDTATVRSFVRRILPEYMVPSFVKVLDAIPLTTSGKADLAMLSELATQPQLSEAAASPRNPEEKTLCRIWRELLELEDVGIHDSFFDLGGHSLLATRAIARINEAFYTSLPSRAIFENPSIAELAKMVQTSAGGKGGQA